MIGINANRPVCSTTSDCLVRGSGALERMGIGEITVVHFNHLFEPKEIPIFLVKFRLCPHQIQKSSGTPVAVLRPQFSK